MRAQLPFPDPPDFPRGLWAAGLLLSDLSHGDIASLECFLKISPVEAWGVVTFTRGVHCGPGAGTCTQDKGKQLCCGPGSGVQEVIAPVSPPLRKFKRKFCEAGVDRQAPKEETGSSLNQTTWALSPSTWLSALG